MFEKIITRICNGVAERLKDQQIVEPTIEVVEFETMGDIALTEGEKTTLHNYGKSGVLSIILDKWVMALAIKNLTCKDALETAEIRGGMKMLQFVQSELMNYAPREKVNRTTGEIDS